MTHITTANGPCQDSDYELMDRATQALNTVFDQVGITLWRTMTMALGKLTKQDLLRQQEAEEDAWSCFRLYMFYKPATYR
jgi:hypothetical protein